MPKDESRESFDEELERLRVTLASIGDAVITTDTRGQVTFLNRAAESLTGWRHEEALGLPLEAVFNIVNEETRQKAESPATLALREGLIVGLANHTLLVGKDGSEVPIDDSASPIRDSQGNVCGVVLIFRDVAERRKAELALRESEERFRLLVECVKDYAIFMLDPEGYIASWNAGAEAIKGYRAHEIIGQHFSKFYTADALEIGWPMKELKMAAEQGRFEDEGWRVRKDGSQFWANVVITALRDEAGHLKGFAKVTRDLTQRRTMERLRAQAEVLADLDRRKDEFLAMLSHELRNPLAAILNSVHLLRLSPEDPPLRTDSIALIDRQMGHLVRLIDDLLEVSRIATGRIRLALEHTDLRAAVQRAHEAARETITRRRQCVSLSLPDQPVWVYADRTRVDQVILNLLTNASKYNDEGGQIWIAVEQQEKEAVLRVRDSGIGIGEDLLPHIFELFTQAEHSLDRSHGGLGVGLTIVQRIVQMHSGTVAAFSAGPGKGSEFVVRLPVLPPTAALPDVKSSSLRSSRRLRVLVVDDNKDAANTTAKLLALAGHEVQVAYSGPAALREAAGFKPDTVLLDLGLPEIDGFEVARRLRQDPALAQVRLIALSGYGQEADRQRSQEAGFDAHLVKPADPQQLAELLAAKPA